MERHGFGETRIMAVVVGGSCSRGDGLEADLTWGNESSQQLALKVRGVKFHKFLQSVRLKAGSFKGQEAGVVQSPDSPRALCCCWRGGRQTAHRPAAWKQMRRAPEAHRGELICLSQSLSPKDRVHGETLLITKELPFPSATHQHKHRDTCRTQCGTHTPYLT